MPSTLSEALLLEYMLARSTDPDERIVLLQHAIDNITGTFFTQVHVRRLRAARAPAGRAGPADHVGDPDRHLHDAAEGLLRRRGRHEPAHRPHLGAHSALLQLAVLRLPVRDLLRVGGAAGAARSCAVAKPARGARALPDAAALGRQRLSDGAAEEGGRRSRAARHGRAVIDQLDDLVTRLERELASSDS